MMYSKKSSGIRARTGAAAANTAKTAHAATRAATRSVIEQLETRAMMSATVTSFTLVNAATDQDLMTINAGDTLNLATLPTTKLNIRANVNGETTVVKFDLDGARHTEKSAPFALAGDKDGDYKAWTPALGRHTLTATGYDGSVKGQSMSIGFNVINQAAPTAPETEDPTPQPTPEPEPTPQPDPTPTPIPTPSPGVKPSAANTGPTGTLRVINSGITITEDNTVLENVDVRGDIRVKANNVTIRNFKATGIKFYDEAKYGGFRNLLVEYGEISDPSGGTGVVIGHGTLRYTEIHHMGSDGVNVHEDTVVEYNYIHHLGMNDASHADGISGSSPDGKPVLGVVIRGNTIDMPAGVDEFRANGCVFVGQFGTASNPMIVEGNWLNGAHYTVNSGINGAVIVYRNNYFGRDYQTGLWKSHTGETFEAGTRTGNVWEDTGKAV